MTEGKGFRAQSTFTGLKVVCDRLSLTVGNRRWSSKGARGGRGYGGPVETLPELMAACDGKEDNFTSVVREVLQPNQIAQVCHPASTLRP